MVNLKKLISLAIAILLVCSTGTSVFAATSNTSTELQVVDFRMDVVDIFDVDSEIMLYGATDKIKTVGITYNFTVGVPNSSWPHDVHEVSLGSATAYFNYSYSETGRYVVCNSSYWSPNSNLHDIILGDWMTSGNGTQTVTAMSDITCTYNGGSASEYAEVHLYYNGGSLKVA